MRVGLIVALLAAGGCGAGSREAKDAREIIAGTGIVELDRLTAAETLVLIDIVRVEASPCEGQLSLLESLESSPICERAVRALGFIYRRILEGYGREDVLDQYVARFKHAKPVKLDIEGCPDTGPGDALVTITVFSDFECPHCRKAASRIGEVKAEHPDEVRVVFKHFPLPSIHEEAMNAALAAAAAHLQGRFWEMHDALYGREGGLDSDLIEDAAVKAGLDMERWHQDVESPDVLDIVNRDLKHAQDLDLEGTPTIFVDGMLYTEPLKYLDQVVEEKLIEAG